MPEPKDRRDRLILSIVKHVTDRSVVLSAGVSLLARVEGVRRPELQRHLPAADAARSFAALLVVSTCYRLVRG
jgi:hypothetical protein